LTQARLLAVAALVVAVSAPFWLDRALGLAGLHTPGAVRLAATRSGLEAEERQLAALGQVLDAMATELAGSRAEAAQVRARTEALAGWSGLYALSDLAASLRRSAPFGLQLAVARAVAVLPEARRGLLDQLAPYAAIGVPSGERIGRDFAARTAGLGWDGVEYAPVVVVNRLIAWSGRQLPGGPSPSSRGLAEANARLAAGDIAGAAEAVRQLPAPVRDGFADWLQDAGARAAADRLSREVDRMLADAKPIIPEVRK
jgi:hypothetical protein